VLGPLSGGCLRSCPSPAALASLQGEEHVVVQQQARALYAELGAECKGECAHTCIVYVDCVRVGVCGCIRLHSGSVMQLHAV